MTLRVALAQIETLPGDVAGNRDRALAAWHAAAEEHADLVVLPELTLPGYPPQDLILIDELVQANLVALEELAAAGPSGCTALVGFVDRLPAPDPSADTLTPSVERLTNAAAVLRDGEVIDRYAKRRLTNHGPFSEARYFAPGARTLVTEVAGVPVGVTICQDMWTDDGPVQDAARAGATVVANLNASPYHRGKLAVRTELAARHARRAGVSVLYTNAVGTVDDLVFDGRSFVVTSDGEVAALGAHAGSDLVIVDLPASGTTADARPAPRWQAPEQPDELGEVWEILTTSVADYCRHHGFEQVIVGLSGGIDSAVVATLAADALGSDRLITVAMPSPYSSAGSLEDAAALSERLGCTHHVVPIDGPLQAASEALGGLVVTGFDRPDGRSPGVAYENMQSRLRGLVVMTLANETGAIVLTTGNRSEYAVGYATLYGDMAGGYAPLKDVPKQLVYALARWRNRYGEVIPIATIEKPPSAELRPGQVDQDSLPPYDVLDALIAGYIEEDLDVAGLVARGFDETLVRRVLTMIDRAEHKRRQAAPGPMITARPFGTDRRWPITHRWRH